MITGIELVLFAALAAVLYFLLTDGPKYKNLPPGPKGLPILGSLLSLGRQPHLKLSEWVKDYGNVFWVKAANYRVLMISDAQLAREAFNNPALLGKPKFALFDFFADGEHGIFSTNGEVWVEQRRFTLRNLRDFGFGKSTIQDLYLNEVTDFIEMMKSANGKSISLNRKFGLAAINSLWMIMTGKRFQLEDKSLEAFMDKQNDIFKEATRNILAVFFPNIAQKLPKLSGWYKLQELLDDFTVLMNTPIKEHLPDFDPDNPPRDFIDVYLKEIKTCDDAKSSFHGKTGEKNLEVVIADLFGAGTATTAETLSFAVMYLCKYPEIQKKFQNEIDKVVGHSRAIVLSDRKDMPYTEAMILETLRKSTITPYGIFHAALETTTLNGYTIPKDTWVGVNMYHIHHNPEIWKNPHEFRPERFLSPDGTTVVRNDNLIPFSVGKRMCIGEQLARDGVFMFLTNIFQKFSIAFDPNMPEPDLRGKTDLFNNCEKFHVILTERNA